MSLKPLAIHDHDLRDPIWLIWLMSSNVLLLLLWQISGALCSLAKQVANKRYNPTFWYLLGPTSRLSRPTAVKVI